MTSINGHNPMQALPGAASPPWYGAPEIEPAEREPRFPSFVALASACYLASVPLLSAAARYEASWVPQAIGATLALCWLLFGITRGHGVTMSLTVTLYVAWMAWTVTGLLVVPNPEVFIIRLKTAGKVVVVTWLCSQCVRTRADLLICLLAAALAAPVIFFEGVDDIVQAASYEGESRAGRVDTGATLISNANSLAITTVTMLLGAGICFLCYRKWLFRLLALVPVPFCLYIVSASGSRTGMIGLMLAGLAVFWFHFRRPGAISAGKKLAMIMVGLAVGLGAIIYVARSPFFFFIVETLTSKEEITKQPRFRYFVIGMEATIENPVFGLGLGGFAAEGLSGAKSHYSHSTVTETMCCTGVPGFLLYFGSQFAFFVLAYRLRKRPLPRADRTIVNMLMAFIFVLQFFNVVGVLYYQRFLWPLTGAMCGYLEYLRKRYPRPKPQTLPRATA